MPSVYGCCKSPERARVLRDFVLQVRHPERNVSSLVLSRELSNSPGNRIRRVLLKKPEQIEECAFTQNRQQERGQGKVRLLKQRFQRRLTADRRKSEFAALQQSSARENLNMTSLIRDLYCQ